MSESSRDEAREPDLHERVRRAELSLESVYLIAKTFASLGLFERDAICDTLLSQTGTYLDAEHGAILACSHGAPSVLALRGSLSSDMLATEHAARVCNKIIGERVAQVITAAELARLWPDAPPQLAGGMVGARWTFVSAPWAS